MADCLHLIGRHDDAAALFERLVGLRNDLGLLAEEYDVQAGRQVGNFPQAFSHVSLVNAAYNLTRPPRHGGPGPSVHAAEPSPHAPARHQRTGAAPALDAGHAITGARRRNGTGRSR